MADFGDACYTTDSQLIFECDLTFIFTKIGAIVEEQLVLSWIASTAPKLIDWCTMLIGKMCQQGLHTLFEVLIN